MDFEHYPELYEAAREVELKQFSDRLYNLSGRMTQADGMHRGIEFQRRVTLPDESVQTVSFSAFYYPSHDQFEISSGRAMPIRKSLEVSHIGAVQDEDEHGMEIDVIDSTDADDEIDEEEAEGFIENEKQLRLFVSSGMVEGHITCLMNVLDEEFRTVDCHVGFGPDIFVRQDIAEVRDLNQLWNLHVPILDTIKREQEQSIVTRADLIIATELLKQCGLLHPLTKAYKGAPIDIALANGLECFGDDALIELGN